MTRTEALEIVLQLAQGNALEEKEILQDEEILRPMAEEQQIAIELVSKF